MKIEKDKEGYESIVIDNAKVSDLVKYLDPNTPYIWLFGHMPNPRVEWWKTQVPLNKTEFIEAEVRNIEFDCQLTTNEFIKKADQFNDFGLNLVQSTKPMPNNLDIYKIPENTQCTVLIKNGATLRVWLPHSVETAVVTSFKEGYLSEICG
ncbi:MAG: hypothetical protein OEY52_14880 [Gammaproteobacteria bacterium]|nr:hypothetical protein [Gammaproteobacteria bacterium]